ncbi:MAG: glutamate formimidoyltransferase [Lentimicrobiaceae bacterium]|mgnify:FL=1|jgi:glutamate formiminotransferase/formiminotetrahydrofolate cyclodeaminase|nr:glutamate formimidoyltransferase [Lentimicrobiaceae bacterium]MCP4909554.1 glutamate formimidoyltransferase [Bacteroidota bacterium]MBT3453464.1 glutamate formimidoyltransferase [Lentimicrobiaceae bacterium]MBT3818997.1 glutamate formimidoyltransferase [Lentimicrobiaceae bacterium]MBT4060474.1 glutamate formimidoyltransferase [Lentimicrobiaceae bacterium]
MKQLIECVPNFSEGRDMAIIKQITDEIERVEGVKLLDVDPGAATNRTVVTMVGTPDDVLQAAFAAVKKASELIDMSNQKGEHPRFGATDVCPLVPISNITMEETVEYARKLGERIGKELLIPIYCYENAAFETKRQNLANCRSGEYEGLKEKLSNPEWKPDFGPDHYNESIKRTGVTAVGARDFLVAFNVNLNTTSTRRANAIAFDVRERGRVKREGNPLTGKIVNDKHGKPVMIPGSLKEVKAIGWFIDEYDVAQISMNLTNISITPVHIAYDEVWKKAEERGIRVTGSELVGLVPLEAMLEAGRYFLRKQKRSVGVDNNELVRIAIKSMGLDDLSEFNPKEKIIEFMLDDDGTDKLVDMSLTDFANETASESPAPGGGSISAYVGALGVSLGTMVANLSSHKRGWDHRWEEFSDWAVKGQQYKDMLLHYVDEDTNSFNNIMDAFGLPKNTDSEKEIRINAIEAASKYAMEIPFKVMETSLQSMEVMKAMADIGNPNSVSDAGVGALCALTAVEGAYLNVKINASGINDKTFTDDLLNKGLKIAETAKVLRDDIIEVVDNKISEL